MIIKLKAAVLAMAATGAIAAVMLSMAVISSFVRWQYGR